VVAEVMSDIEAELIAGFLRSQDLPARVATIDHTEGGGGYGVRRARVMVAGERFDEAIELLRSADHVDAHDPGSAIDVGQPADEDVRDYLAWRAAEGDTGEVEGGADKREPDVTSPVVPGADLTAPRTGQVPLVPLLLVAAAAVAAIVLLFH